MPSVFQLQFIFHTGGYPSAWSLQVLQLVGESIALGDALTFLGAFSDLGHLLPSTPISRCLGPVLQSHRLDAGLRKLVPTTAIGLCVCVPSAVCTFPLVPHTQPSAGVGVSAAASEGVPVLARPLFQAQGLRWGASRGCLPSSSLWSAGGWQSPI